ncbi:MAG: DUF6069 family protein [Aeromicrobium sp.]
MSTAHPPVGPRGRTDPRGRDLVLAMIVGGVAAIAANVAIGAVARSVGASSDFSPLAPAELVVPTIFGTVVGAVGWFVIARRVARPWAVFRVAAPAVVLVSLIPDVIMWVGGSEPGTSAGAVIALMLTHLATGVVLVAVFQHVMPVDRSQS